MAGEPERLLETPVFYVERIHYSTRAGGDRTRSVVRHPGAVAIVPMVDQDHVCLIRNFRPSVNRTLIEIPAGTLEPGESVEQTARRELLEETGYKAGYWQPLHALFLSPGILDERMHLFLAEDLHEVGAAREPGEEIENLIVPFHDALQMVYRGEIEDAKTIVGLLLYAQQRRQAEMNKGVRPL